MTSNRLRFLSLALSFTASLLAIGFLGRATYSYKDFILEAKINVNNPGTTTISLGPLGELTGHTHISPLGIDVAVRNVDFELINKLCEMPQERLPTFKEALKNGKKAIEELIINLALLSFASGAIAPLLFGYRQMRTIVFGGLQGMLCLVCCVTLTLATYRLDVLNQLLLTDKAGNISQDGIVETATYGIGNLGRRLATVSRNLPRLLESVELLNPLSTPHSDLRILQVSDIHSNPAAYDLMKQFIKSFKINAIVDCGDITDWGTSYEAQQLAKIAHLQIPYLFVPGNHDTVEIIKTMKSIPNVTVLQNNQYRLDRLVISGSVKQKRADIVAVHEKEKAKSAIGSFPIVLHGHDHKLKFDERKGTIVIDAGTLGGAGMRGLEEANGMPQSLVLLYFKTNPSLTLVGVDTFKIKTIITGFTINRRILMKDLRSLR